jgi:hypothetical protein
MHFKGNMNLVIPEIKTEREKATGKQVKILSKAPLPASGRGRGLGFLFWVLYIF